jgi:hypothetical protein
MESDNADRYYAANQMILSGPAAVRTLFYDYSIFAQKKPLNYFSGA